MRVKRIAAALLAFAITVGIAGNAYSENTGQAMTAEIETAVSDKVQAEAEVSIPEPEQESESKIVRTELTEQNLPDVIDAETAIADGYVARLNSEEQSLSEVVLEKTTERGHCIFSARMSSTLTKMAMSLTSRTMP